MIQTIPIAQAKNELPKLITNAHKSDTEYTITSNNSSATLISTQKLESLKETLEILSSPQLMEEIKKATQEVKNGDIISLEEFKKELQKDV